MENIPTDVASWFASIPALATVVAALVALIRKHIAKLDGKIVILLSAMVGVALAYFGKLLGFLSTDWFYFGLMAGLTASGGVDLVRGLFGNAKAAKSATGKRRVI